MEVGVDRLEREGRERERRFKDEVRGFREDIEGGRGRLEVVERERDRFRGLFKESEMDREEVGKQVEGIEGEKIEAIKERDEGGRMLERGDSGVPPIIFTNNLLAIPRPNPFLDSLLSSAAVAELHRILKERGAVGSADEERKKKER